MSAIATRPAVLEDLEILLEFEQGIIAAERPFDPTLKEGHINYYDLIELVVSTNAEVVVATVDEKIIGSGYVNIQQSKPYLSHHSHGYIGFMYVSPEHRGKGVIQKITDDLLAWARSKGLNEVRLEVYSENTAAVRAYEKAGFQKNLVEMRRAI